MAGVSPLAPRQATGTTLKPSSSGMLTAALSAPHSVTLLEHEVIAAGGQHHAVSARGFVAYGVGSTIVLWHWDSSAYAYLTPHTIKDVARSGAGWVCSLALTPDGLYLASCHSTPDKAVLVLWDVSGFPTAEAVIIGHTTLTTDDPTAGGLTDGVHACVQFSPDGRLAYTLHYVSNQSVILGDEDVAAVLTVWDWPAPWLLLEQVQLPFQPAYWTQPPADGCLLPWGRQLSLGVASTASSVVVVGCQQVCTWTYQRQALSGRWALANTMQYTPANQSVMVAAAGSVAAGGVIYVAVANPSAVLCVNQSGRAIVQCAFAHSPVSEFQLGAVTSLGLAGLQVWIGTSSGQIVQLDSVTLKPIRRLPYQAEPRRRLSPSTAPPAGSGRAAARSSNAGAGGRTLVVGAAGAAGDTTAAPTGWDCLVVAPSPTAEHMCVQYLDGSQVMLQLSSSAVIAYSVPHFGAVRALQWHELATSPQLLASGSVDQSLCLWQFPVASRPGTAPCTAWKNQPRCVFDLPSCMSAGLSLKSQASTLLQLSYSFPTPTAVAIARMSNKMVASASDAIWEQPLSGFGGFQPAAIIAPVAPPTAPTRSVSPATRARAGSAKSVRFQDGGHGHGAAHAHAHHGTTKVAPAPAAAPAPPAAPTPKSPPGVPPPSLSLPMLASVHVTALTFHPNGSAIMCGDNHGILRLFSVSTGKLLQTLDIYQDRPSAPAMELSGNAVSSEIADIHFSASAAYLAVCCRRYDERRVGFRQLTGDVISGTVFVMQTDGFENRVEVAPGSALVSPGSTPSDPVVTQEAQLPLPSAAFRARVLDASDGSAHLIMTHSRNAVGVYRVRRYGTVSAESSADAGRLAVWKVHTFKCAGVITGWDLHPCGDYLVCLSHTGILAVYHLWLQDLRGVIPVVPATPGAGPILSVLASGCCIDPSGLYCAVATVGVRWTTTAPVSVSAPYNAASTLIRDRPSMEPVIPRGPVTLPLTRIALVDLCGGSLVAQDPAVPSIASLSWAPSMCGPDMSVRLPTTVPPAMSTAPQTPLRLAVGCTSGAVIVLKPARALQLNAQQALDAGSRTTEFWSLRPIFVPPFPLNKTGGTPAVASRKLLVLPPPPAAGPVSVSHAGTQSLSAPLTLGTHDQYYTPPLAQPAPPRIPPSPQAVWGFPGVDVDALAAVLLAATPPTSGSSTPVSRAEHVPIERIMFARQSSGLPDDHDIITPADLLPSHLPASALLSSRTPSPRTVSAAPTTVVTTGLAMDAALSTLPGDNAGTAAGHRRASAAGVPTPAPAEGDRRRSATDAVVVSATGSRVPTPTPAEGDRRRSVTSTQSDAPAAPTPLPAEGDRWRSVTGTQSDAAAAASTPISAEGDRRRSVTGTQSDAAAAPTPLPPAEGGKPVATAPPPVNTASRPSSVTATIIPAPPELRDAEPIATVVATGNKPT